MLPLKPSQPSLRSVMIAPSAQTNTGQSGNYGVIEIHGQLSRYEGHVSLNVLVHTHILFLSIKLLLIIYIISFRAQALSTNSTSLRHLFSINLFPIACENRRNSFHLSICDKTKQKRLCERDTQVEAFRITMKAGAFVCAFVTANAFDYVQSEVNICRTWEQT